MARWWVNDRGPDKIVEGPYSKGETTAIASSKKGKPVSISRCPEEAPTVAVLEMQTLHEHIRNLKKGSTVIHICLTYILL